MHSNTDNNSSNGINSRRSACDRCRGHKLRCVRLSGSNFSTESNPGLLPACERCVKAGAECLQTRSMRRASLRGSNYERPGAAFRRSLDGNGPAVSSDGIFQDPSSHTPFSLALPTQQVEQGRMSVAAPSRSQKGPSQARPASRDWRRRTMVFDHTDINAAPRLEPFPMPMTTTADRDMGSGTGISFELDESFNTELPSFEGSFDRGPRPVSLSNQFGDGSDDVVNLAKNSNLTDRGSDVDKEMDKDKDGNEGRDKDECLYQLSKLSARLMRHFGKTDGHPVTLEDILSYSTPATVNGGHGAKRDSCDAKNIIGILLQSSQMFLEILEQLESSMAQQQDRQQQPCSPSNSEYSYVDSPSEMEMLFGESSGRDDMPMSEFLIHNDEVDGLTAHLPNAKHHQPFSTPPATVTGTTAALGSSNRRQASFSIPYTLTVMTCYMWLLHGYEIVFAAIQDSLLSQREQRRGRAERRDGSSRMTQGSQTLASPFLRTMAGSKRMEPFVLPNIRIGGFSLDGQPNLQVEMLIH
ncbi:hypothetical protein ED733_004464 [Metarhizium rileyi]|uniref:Zn(2)-C6 fungal-type domain-containing protein n=1 Tax=Metarhizium rileyi (strain RCEF 4871) TaxID=1649241 RepID=A0A5C6G5Y2_METRR|nr:hypothetical protein ED733_004464 [Metarhizium rileyi]